MNKLRYPPQANGTFSSPTVKRLLPELTVLALLSLLVACSSTAPDTSDTSSPVPTTNIAQVTEGLESENVSWQERVPTRCAQGEDGSQSAHVWLHLKPADGVEFSFADRRLAPVSIVTVNPDSGELAREIWFFPFPRPRPENEAELEDYKATKLAEGLEGPVNFGYLDRDRAYMFSAFVKDINDEVASGNAIAVAHGETSTGERWVIGAYRLPGC